MAMDLIVLYKDGVASEDSKRAIREHLKSCPVCAEAFRNYIPKRKMPPRPRHIATEDEISAKYKLLAKNLRRSHMMSTAAVAAVIAFSLAVGGISVIKLLARYEESDI